MALLLWLPPLLICSAGEVSAVQSGAGTAAVMSTVCMFVSFVFVSAGCNYTSVLVQRVRVGRCTNAANDQLWIMNIKRRVKHLQLIEFSPSLTKRMFNCQLVICSFVRVRTRFLLSEWAHVFIMCIKAGVHLFN